jgi:hypothetical protein
MNIAALLLALLVQVQAPLPDASVGTTRGITGSISVHVPDGVLRARPDLALDDPLLVRIAASRPLPEGGHMFDLEYMGTEAGTHDLRTVLVFADGRPIDTLPPIEVRIATHLGLNAPSDLDMTKTPPATLRGGYLMWLSILAALWIAVPVIVIVRRLLRHTPPEVLPAPPPTLADLLQPLVLAASEGALSIDEQARLELLLHRHWSQHLQLDMPPHEAIAVLRQHETAGVLLRAIEDWLHRPHVDGDGHNKKPSREEIVELLSPYAAIPVEPTS